METTIEQERVRVRVSEYIANKGYIKERTFGPERLGLDGFPLNGRAERIGLKIYSFWDGLSTLTDLKYLFEPVRRVYQEGKSIYAKTSILTPKYKKISEKNSLYERAIQEHYENNPGFLRFNRLMHRLIRASGGYMPIIPLPLKISDHESRQALNQLYLWLQENQNGNIFTSLPKDSSDLGVLLERVKRDLFKIKNHTSIVCLDQLQKDGLILDERVSKELGKIPPEYLKDPFIWNKAVSNQFMLKDRTNYFGGGLF